MNRIEKNYNDNKQKIYRQLVKKNVVERDNYLSSLERHLEKQKEITENKKLEEELQQMKEDKQKEKEKIKIMDENEIEDKKSIEYLDLEIKNKNLKKNKK